MKVALESASVWQDNDTLVMEDSCRPTDDVGVLQVTPLGVLDFGDMRTEQQCLMTAGLSDAVIRHKAYQGTREVNKSPETLWKHLSASALALVCSIGFAASALRYHRTGDAGSFGSPIRQCPGRGALHRPSKGRGCSPFLLLKTNLGVKPLVTSWLVSKLS